MPDLSIKSTRLDGAGVRILSPVHFHVAQLQNGRSTLLSEAKGRKKKHGTVDPKAASAYGAVA